MKRHVAALFSNGKIKLIEDTVPPLTKGMVRIKTICSLVSPGSELKGWDALAKQRINPETEVSQKKFGYSVTGIIDAVGENVSSRLKVGLRVAAIGAGYAQHSDYVVVPQNLCFEVPKNVKSSDASYAMLIATALQVLRRAKPEIGEYYLVCGLGIVGLLTAKLLQLNGCKVLGIDNHSTRVELAKRWGIDQVVLDSDLDYDKKLDSFTEKEGFDGAVLAFGGRADGPLDRIVKHMRLCPDSHRTGNIVVVGWPVFSYKGEIGNMNNINLLRSSRTGAGYHDPEWEISDRDYPEVFVRWTTRKNVKFCLQLLESGKIDVSSLTTNFISLMNVEQEIDKCIEHPENMLGVIFENR